MLINGVWSRFTKPLVPQQCKWWQSRPPRRSSGAIRRTDENVKITEKASEFHLAKVGHKRGSRTWTKVDHQRATGSINENNVNLACLFSIVVAFGVLWKQGNRILHHQHSAWIPFNFLLPSLIPPCQREQGKLGLGVQAHRPRVKIKYQ